MKKYELAYETKGEMLLIIPHLLPKDCPDRLPEFPDRKSLKI